MRSKKLGNRDHEGGARDDDHSRLAVEPCRAIAMADSTTQNPCTDSKAADDALIEALKEVNFQDDGWDRFAKELACYGLPIISSWISSLRIFAKCADKSGDCPGPPHNIHKLSDNKASEMANEIIARALNKFRDKVLRPSRRSPTGEASLNVMFITQCILQFPNVYRQWHVENKWPLTDNRNVYRQWHVENKRLLTDNRYDGLEELEFMVAGPDGDPAGLVVIRKEIAHALEHYVKDPQVAAALIPRGYATGESDEMLDVTKNALDGVLQCHWIALRGRLDNLDGDVEEGTTAP